MSPRPLLAKATSKDARRHLLKARALGEVACEQLRSRCNEALPDGQALARVNVLAPLALLDGLLRRLR